MALYKERLLLLLLLLFLLLFDYYYYYYRYRTCHTLFLSTFSQTKIFNLGCYFFIQILPTTIVHGLSFIFLIVKFYLSKVKISHNKDMVFGEAVSALPRLISH